MGLVGGNIDGDHAVVLDIFLCRQLVLSQKTWQMDDAANGFGTAASTGGGTALPSSRKWSDKLMIFIRG